MLESDIAKYRLVNQQIAETKLTNIVEMVSWLGAVQAQEYSRAKWAIGLRLPEVKDTDVEQAFQNGEIIRTHLLRPTWHFVAPADIRWMLELTAPRVKAVNAYMNKKMELNDEIFKVTNNILAKALEGKKQLTRIELQKILEEKNIIADGTRLTCIMMQAELDAVICSGARKGKQFTYSLLDEVVPQTEKLDKDQALAELAKRYFFSRGPATLKDFSVWSGLSMSEVKRGLEIIKSSLIKEKIDNEEYYFPPTFIEKDIFKKAYLLPIYDEYIMGYKNRSAITLNLKDQIDIPIVFDQNIIIEGQIVGTWKRTINAKSIDLEYKFYKPLSEENISLFNQSVDDYSKFMESDVNLAVNTIET